MNQQTQQAVDIISEQAARIKELEALLAGAPKAELTDERAAFEAWAKNQGSYDLRPAKVKMLSVRGEPYDGYVRPYLQDRTVYTYQGFAAGVAYARAVLAQAAPVADDDENVEADAYMHACELMEEGQRERAKRGVEIGTQGSLCDGIAWLFDQMKKLESATPAAPAAGPAPADGWISVAERLPEDCQDVLVLYPDTGCEPAIWSAKWLSGSKTFESSSNGWADLDDITHWMPRPAIPAAPAPEAQ